MSIKAPPFKKGDMVRVKALLVLPECQSGSSAAACMLRRGESVYEVLEVLDRGISRGRRVWWIQIRVQMLMTPTFDARHFALVEKTGDVVISMAAMRSKLRGQKA